MEVPKIQTPIPAYIIHYLLPSELNSRRLISLNWHCYSIELILYEWGELHIKILIYEHVQVSLICPFFMFIRKTMWRERELEDLIVCISFILTASNNGWSWGMFVQSVRRQLWKLMKIRMHNCLMLPQNFILLSVLRMSLRMMFS